MALGKIASPRSRGKAAAEALKKLEQDFRKTSESSVRELCAAANRELKYLTEILSSGKFAPARKTPPNPPGAIFAKPSRRQTPSDLRPLPEALELSPSPTALAASTVCA